MKQISWKVLLLAGVILLLSAILIGLMGWAGSTLRPSEVALSALESDDQVQVSRQRGWIAFESLQDTPDTGFLFYPGGRVDFRAYAPPLRQIAERGYLVVLLHMPLNMALLDTAAAGRAIAVYPQIENWAIGGHSLGGVAAASFAAGQPAVDGLVLWAAYPAGEALKDEDLAVLSVYGSHDGVLPVNRINQSRPFLPADSRYVEIAGGNHAQFGSYGAQRGDNPAGISAEEQWSQVVQATVALMETISTDP